MRGNSLLQDAIVCITAYGPLNAICGDPAVWRAWIDFASCHLFKFLSRGDSHQGWTDGH